MATKRETELVKILYIIPEGKEVKKKPYGHTHLAINCMNFKTFLFLPSI